MKAFTLIEVMVVTVVLGILSAIGQPVYIDYADKAVDATKIYTINQALKVIRLDATVNDSNLNYVYGAAEFNALLSNSDYGLFPVDQENCFFMVSGIGASQSSAKDNKIAIMVWGESTSTANPQTPGLIIDGDADTVEYFLNAGVTREDLMCRNAWVWQAPSFINTAYAKADKVEMCHAGKTLLVNAKAVDSHLKHGDPIGPCPPAEGGGEVEPDPTPDPEPEAEPDGEGNTMLQRVADADMGSIRASLLIDPDGNILEIEREGF